VSSRFDILLQGCPSWNWYYPFHYAPFASDLVNIDSFDVSFELSKPFLPTEQLLAVFPSDSVHAIPESCRWLMTSNTSPIRDLYSSDIPIDPNGKILPWLWVVLLPFIDENRITNAMQLCLANMSPEEKRRNSFGKSYMFLHRSHPLCCHVTSLLSYDNPAPAGGGDECCRFNPALEGGGVGGTLRVPSAQCFFPLSAKVTAPDRPLRAFRDITHNDVACFEFELPPELPHLSSLLAGADAGPDVLTPSDSVIRIPRLNKGMNIMDIAHRMKGGEGLYHNNSQMGFGAYHQVQDQYQRQQVHQFGEQQGLRSYGGNKRGGYNGGGGDLSEYSYRNQSSYSYDSRDGGASRGGGTAGYAGGHHQASYGDRGGGYGGVNSGQGYGGYGQQWQQHGHGGSYGYSGGSGGQSQYSLPVSSGARSGDYSYNPSSRQQSYSGGGGGGYGGQGQQQRQGGYGGAGYGYQQQQQQQQQQQHNPSHQQRYPPAQPQSYQQPSYGSGGYLQQGGFQGRQEEPRDSFSFRQSMHSNQGGGSSYGSGAGGSIADMRSQLGGGQQRGPPPRSAPPRSAPPPQPFSHSRDPRLRK
jgi:5'-3' exoribonuclease 2